MTGKLITAVAAATLAMAACGEEDTDTMTDRAVALADSIDELSAGILEHYFAVGELDDIELLGALEDDLMVTVDADLYWVGFWTAEMATCSDDDGAPPIAHIDDLVIELRRETATHALMVGMAGDVDTVQSEEQRYLIATHAMIGDMRVDQFAMESVATQYACPVFDALPTILSGELERLE